MVIIIIITNSIISHFVTIELDILALASTEVQESIVATWITITCWLFLNNLT